MIAGMSITDERKQTFDFSEPYFDSGIQMAVKADNDAIEGYEDLDGKVTGAKVGTESADFLEENKDKYGFTVKLYDAADTLYGAINNGTVDAIFDDYPVLGYAITNGQPFRLVGDAQEGSAYGFAVKKGENQELLQMFNDGLADLKESGEYDKIDRCQSRCIHQSYLEIQKERKLNRYQSCKFFQQPGLLNQRKK